MLDFSRFGSMLTLEAFGPFKSGVNALENINSISEGAWPHDHYNSIGTMRVYVINRFACATILLN